MTPSVLLISSGLWHPSVFARRALRAGLEPHARLDHASTLDALTGIEPARLAAYNALVLYVHHKRISDPALKRLESYVAGGGALLAWHSASASFKESTRYRELLGGYFTEHGPVTEFSVQPAQLPPEPFSGIGPFTVRDELYRHKCFSGNEVFMTTEIDGEREAVAWTRYFGDGCIFYCSLGHTAESLRHPAAQKLMGQSLRWVVQG